MLVGVLADSHDHLQAIEQAVMLFNQKQVDFVIHAGDFISPFSLKPLECLDCPWIGVFGNNDGEQKGLTHLSKGKIQPAPYELSLDARKVVVVHDLQRVDSNDLIEKGAQLVIYAHTHQAEFKRPKEGVLFINPGELGGWLYGKRTVGLVDTVKLDAWLEEIVL